MYKNIELIITFVLQFFILDIQPNLFNIIGSVAIAVGVLMIMGFRLIEKETNDVKGKKVSSIQKLFFYKF
jgi:hypothetical protein